MPKTLEEVIAKALSISTAQVSADLEYQSVREWDSLGHVELMLALEEAFGVTISPDEVLELTNVTKIRNHLAQKGKGLDQGKQAVATSLATAVSVAAPEDSSKKLYRGLAGIHFDRSTICDVNGQKSELCYRGYSIHDLFEHSTFEETASLIIDGQLPTARSLQTFTAAIRQTQELPSLVVSMIRELSQEHPMQVLRTAVSMLGALDLDRERHDVEACRRKGIRLISQVPLIIATQHAARTGRALPKPDSSLSHAAHFLYLMHGKAPSPDHARMLDRDLILHAEHSSNASTFVARAATATRADFHSATTAAIGTFSGSLHGGAVEDVMKMLREIGDRSRAAAYVEKKLSVGEQIMGFGHRVYKIEDPRARHLRDMAFQISRQKGDTRLIDLLEELVRSMERHTRHGLAINVDLYAGASYEHLGIPEDMFVPVFVMARMAGWTAHILEQQGDNILIRPLLAYEGERNCCYIPLEKR